MMQEKLIDRPRIFPIPAWKNKSFGSGKIFFLGDAAGMVMPVTYEGIYYAMKSGQFAATAIIERKTRNLPQALGRTIRKQVHGYGPLQESFFQG